MSWPGLDYHSHICGAPIDAMIQNARVQGVREFGISEHIFMLHEGQRVFPLLEENGERRSRREYVEIVQANGANGSDIVLRLGLEIDFVPGTEDAIVPVIDGVDWDYLLGSVHEIDGIDLFEYIPATAGEGERLWRRYFELTAEAIESGMFDAITHPVRNAERNLHLPADFDRLLEEVAAFAKFHGVALELNGYDTEHWPDLVERLAAACGRAGCPVSLGSDAHVPQKVARGMAVASRAAVAGGVPSAVSFQRRDRRLIDFQR